MSGNSLSTAHALSDSADRLLSADEPLAGLQQRCGGELPGPIAIPALLEAVRKAREYGLKLARTIHARDTEDAITAWVELTPLADGCEIAVRNWQTIPLEQDGADRAPQEPLADDRILADFNAILDGRQNIVAAESEAPDLQPLLRLLAGAEGRRWTEFVSIDGLESQANLHWRLLDGVRGSVEGSERKWLARLYPRLTPVGEVGGFELTLTADRPLADGARGDEAFGDDGFDRLIARDIAPALRRPLARIVANAETIRARLAGPLAEQYCDYAADIGKASQHMMTLLDDLGDLEAVEADGFKTAPDRIDPADIARRAVGIVRARAREKAIELIGPEVSEPVFARAEFRRVLQILLNLLGNAIRYGPEGSRIHLAIDRAGDVARIHVRDEGAGIPADRSEAVFEKFERLGRSGDGGTGLGLYISRRLARAMGGDLVLAESEQGKGARFTLSLPLIDE